MTRRVGRVKSLGLGTDRPWLSLARETAKITGRGTF